MPTFLLNAIEHYTKKSGDCLVNYYDEVDEFWEGKEPPAYAQIGKRWAEHYAQLVLRIYRWDMEKSR